DGGVRASCDPTNLVATHRGIVSLLSRREEFFCPPSPERGCTEGRCTNRRLRIHVSFDAHQSDDDPLLRRRVCRVGARRRQDGLRERGVARFGVFLGSTLWWLLLSAGVGRLREKLNAKHWRWVNRISGITIAGFGLTCLVKFVR